MVRALRPTLQSALLRAWTRRGLTAGLLWPLAQIYRALVWLRRVLYQSGVFTIQRVDALVLVVGNVVAGGAGKTPTVIALVRHLREQGYTVGVVSRGYGRTSTLCMEVQTRSSAYDVGDEPLLIQHATGAPVYVAQTRHEAALALLAQYPQTRIVVCDDGLQHYALYRDLEICVFDDRGCGNGWHLPAGPLREAWPRRPVSRSGQSPQRMLVLDTGKLQAQQGYSAVRSLASFAVRRDGVHVDLSALTSAQTKPLIAIAGIAQPDAFFAMLRNIGLPLAHTIALPDHYHFSSLPGSMYEGYTLICTEKDAAKLWRLAPDALAIPLVLTCEAAFFSTVDMHVHQLLTAKLSSPHGHQTT